MLIVKLEGGLGNQMFQYAFGKQVSDKYSIPLKMDVSDLSAYRKYELRIFQIEPVFATAQDMLFFDRRNISIFKKILFKVKNPFLESTYFLEDAKRGRFVLPGERQKNIFIRGHWQNVAYFKDIENIIRLDFIFPEITGAANVEWNRMVKKTKSVSIHIRRGDYLLAPINKVHGILNLDYYHKAIQIIKEKITDPVFFIFSDDTEWVKQNLQFAGKVFYVSDNENSQAYIDMQLMSYCKHNIIANSSFSWWAAWLNANPNKIIIAPLQWFADPAKNEFHKNIVPKEWIRL